MAAKHKTKTTADKLRRGTKLGKYKLDKRLGIGGSCEVWRARDTVEGVKVALKIPPENIEGAENTALLREIRLVSKLRHQHILPVKNADIIQGRAVLATELSTKTLDDCSKPMSARRIVSIMEQVLAGLAYAHKHRVVHCDVTPGNIFLFESDRAALGDFGISKQKKGRMETMEEYGTPGYVSPEQAYGRPDYRSDCFSVGLILYEYLTGVLPKWPFKRPFKGEQRVKEKTTGVFLNFVVKALAVEPKKRYANAGKMLEALRKAKPRKLVKKSKAKSKK